MVGLAGLFGFFFFVVYTFIAGTWAKRRSGKYILGAALCLLAFTMSTLLFPGEEEIVEEIAEPARIYQRGIENEKKGLFDKARKDYKIAFVLDPQNRKVIERLQLMERRDIAATFLQVAKRLRRRRQLGWSLVKLKVAKEIAPPTGTLEDSFSLRDRIEKEIRIVNQLMAEKGGRGGFN